MLSLAPHACPQYATRRTMLGMTDTATDGLNDRQRRFVDEYLINGNATAAYARAGYAAKGNATEVNACRLLRHAKVAAAIKAKQEQRSERTQITADKVVAGLLAEAQREGRGSSHSARVAAWTTLARLLGLFEDRSLIVPPSPASADRLAEFRRRYAAGHPNPAACLSDEELDAELERLDAELNRRDGGVVARVERYAAAFEAEAERASQGNPPADGP
jgi:Terminase small subunit